MQLISKFYCYVWRNGCLLFLSRQERWVAMAGVRNGSSNSTTLQFHLFCLPLLFTSFVYLFCLPSSPTHALLVQYSSCWSRPNTYYYSIAIVLRNMKYDIPTLLALRSNATVDDAKFSPQAFGSTCSPLSLIRRRHANYLLLLGYSQPVSSMESEFKCLVGAVYQWT